MIYLLLLTSVVHAYVPSLESLFRNGANKDVTTNTLSIQAKVEKISDVDTATTVENTTAQYFRWIYQHAGADRLKMVQLEYNHPSFGDHFLVDKYYVSQLNPLMFSQGSRGVDQGLYFSVMNSLLINDGSFLINFLKQKNIMAALNEDSINTEKRDLLLQYKNYIAELGKNIKTDNPIEPQDRTQLPHAQKILRSTYINESLKIKLEKWRDEFCWKVESENFEAWVTDEKRQIVKILFKSPGGDFEAIFDDHILLNGSHTFPRVVTIRTTQNEYYKIQFSDLNYFSETESGYITRLKKLDQKNQNKRASIRPSFVF